MATAEKTIKVKNMGPINEAAFVLEGPGVTVFTGPNGSGKSTLLDGLQKAVAGKGKIPLRDGQRKGTLDAFGAVVALGASTRHKGALDVLSLEGKFDLATLVDPGQKDAAAADKQRIKALVGLTGVVADSKLFSEREEFIDFFRIVNESSLETDDLCDMAAKVKRDYEKHARAQEDAAEREAGSAATCAAKIEGVDFSVEISVEEARKRHNDAIAELSRLTAAADAYREAEEDRQAAQAKYAELQKFYEGYNADEIAKGTTELRSKLTACTEAIAQLRDQLGNAEREQEELEAQIHRNEEAERHAKAQEERLAELKAVIDSASERTITPEQLQEAQEAADKASAVYDSARSLESAIRDRDAAQEHEEAAKDLRHQAECLRVIAKSTDEVLSDAINCDALKVVTEDGKIRLVVDHPVRGENVPYHELSEGERWKIAIDLGADQVGEGGLLVIPQVAWESLDVYTRPLVHQHAVGRNVYVLTAEATRDEADGDGIKAKRFETAV